MNIKVDISATIVLYKEDSKELKNTINSFLQIPFLNKKLFIVDNSPAKNLPDSYLKNPRIIYIFNNKNLGFARANNLVINQIKNNSAYHLILNPDIHFKPDAVLKLIWELEKNEEIALITPKIKFPDGNHQYSVRKYPTFFDLFFRKMKINKKRIHNQEYRNLDLSKPFYPQAVHGAFMLFKTDDYIALQGFDERYFLYMEDIDICKKIDRLGKKKMYFPQVEITHVLKKESSKNIKLFYYHLSSAFRYFLKWR